MATADSANSERQPPENLPIESCELLDSRRLTGANLFWDWPAAIIDVAIDGPAQPVVDAWRDAARVLLDGLGQGLDQETERLAWRIHAGGASLLIRAPIDVLYAMCEVNEVAWSMAVARLFDQQAPDLEVEIPRLRAEFDQQANPRLLAMQSSAHDHDVPFLWDDDLVSVGYGASALVWTPDAIPDPTDLDWESISSIPVALVTGTNGKSTTVRMASAIISVAGKRAGLTSTDWIRVGETILDTGDYSGTGGARTLLRHPQTEIAVLETARGGLLRRGLGVETASAALITNVAADHLGDYGINTVPELIEAKFIVRRALHGDAPLILNADDDGVVAFAKSLDNTIIWFSLDADHPLLAEHLANGGTAAFLRDGWLVHATGSHAHPIVEANAIPATLGGAARHNTYNALGALALCAALGIDDRSMRRGLESFHGDEADNPGRGNWFEKDGVRILVDFAHNEHSMKALADMVTHLPAERRVLLMAQAGDRLEQDIQDMTHAACAMQPDRLLICDLPGYERGRAPMETAGIIREAALNATVPAENISLFATPREAVANALGQSLQGDLLVLLVLTQREEVLALIHEFLDRDQAKNLLAPSS